MLIEKHRNQKSTTWIHNGLTDFRWEFSHGFSAAFLSEHLSVCLPPPRAVNVHLKGTLKCEYLLMGRSKCQTEPISTQFPYLSMGKINNRLYRMEMV